VPQIETDIKILPDVRTNSLIVVANDLYNLRTKVASQDRTFELLPSLESLIKQGGLEERTASMKQQELPLDENYYERIVQIRLESLTLEQLVDLLQKLESSEVLVKVKSLHIKKNLTNANLLDSIIEISNLKPSQN